MQSLCNEFIGWIDKGKKNNSMEWDHFILSWWAFCFELKSDGFHYAGTIRSSVEEEVVPDGQILVRDGLDDLLCQDAAQHCWSRAKLTENVSKVNAVDEPTEKSASFKQVLLLEGVVVHDGAFNLQLVLDMVPDLVQLLQVRLLAGHFRIPFHLRAEDEKSYKGGKN